MNYILLFIGASLFGWLFELLFFNKIKYSSDLLYFNIKLPLLTIYGLGAILLSYIYEKSNLDTYSKTFFAIILINVMECIIGNISHAFNKHNTWNYPDEYIPACNGFISIKSSIVWYIFIGLFYQMLDYYKQKN
jgi:uncharacterized membrane protein